MQVAQTEQYIDPLPAPSQRTRETIAYADLMYTPRELGFVDSGGDHAHIIRNETSEPAQTIAVQLIPAHPDGASSAADLRIDASHPGNCHF
jgi:hypothetical protein